MTQETFKHIIRIAHADLDGNKAIYYGLTKIPGISYMISNAICNTLNLDRNKRLGEFTQEEVKKIEDVLKHPSKYKFPLWLLNRRKDPETGIDEHLTAVDLKLRKENDIKLMKKIRSYKGVRHALNLPVRGQRTRAHFRHGATLGVQRKGIKMQLKETKKDGGSKETKKKV